MAEACEVSRSTVQRICKEIKANHEEALGIGISNNLKFLSSRKNYRRKKPNTELDEFDSEVVRRVVHSFYDKGEIRRVLKY